jgi:hypothetical protein
MPLSINLLKPFNHGRAGISAAITPTALESKEKNCPFEFSLPAFWSSAWKQWGLRTRRRHALIGCCCASAIVGCRHHGQGHDSRVVNLIESEHSRGVWLLISRPDWATVGVLERKGSFDTWSSARRKPAKGLQGTGLKRGTSSA